MPQLLNPLEYQIFNSCLNIRSTKANLGSNQTKMEGGTEWHLPKTEIGVVGSAGERC